MYKRVALDAKIRPKLQVWLHHSAKTESAERALQISTLKSALEKIVWEKAHSHRSLLLSLSLLLFAFRISS